MKRETHTYPKVCMSVGRILCRVCGGGCKERRLSRDIFPVHSKFKSFLSQRIMKIFLELSVSVDCSKGHFLVNTTTFLWSISMQPWAVVLHGFGLLYYTAGNIDFYQKD